MTRPRLDDPQYVAAEYADHSGLAARVAFWASRPGPQPQDVELELIRELGPTRVLEVGCGPGVFAARLDDSGIDVTATDQSDGMVALAAARGLRAQRADVQELPYDDGSFDAVVANYMLYHVPDLTAALTEIVRVLRPGGALFAVTNSARHAQELWDLLGLDGGEHAEDAFNSEGAGEVLAPHFASVRRVDVDESFHVTAEATRAYVLATRFADLADRLPALPHGLLVTAAGSVFVATT